MPEQAPENSGYKLEAVPEYLNFQSVEVTEIDEAMPWALPLKVKITKADGTVEEDVNGNTTFFTFTDTQGQKLTVSAAASGHIDDIHFKGEDVGSRFNYGSLEEMLLEAEGIIPVYRN